MLHQAAINFVKRFSELMKNLSAVPKSLFCLIIAVAILLQHGKIIRMSIALLTGPPRLARPPSPGPCTDFGFQYTVIRNNRSKKLG